MRSLLLLLILFSQTFVFGQLVFETNAPSNLAGVYPCIAPNLNWNTPNLNQNGSWFSDTLVYASDGVIGQACGVLTSNVSGQIAIFKRESCDIGMALMNVQNAGANGALIIDTVAGRPLPFNDSIYSGVNIPYVIISKDIGDSLLNELTIGTSCIVSFGDKTGTSNSDVGIYMESSWWSMYGAFPFSNFGFPDSLWGTWLYNHGTDTAFNVGLTFYYEWTDSIYNYVDTTLSGFVVNPFDSIYVDFEFDLPEGVYANFWVGTLYYGYRLEYFDNDTLDNEIENYVISTYDNFSITHDENYWAPIIPDYTLVTESMGSISHKYKITRINVPWSWGYLNVQSAGRIAGSTPQPWSFGVHPADSITTYLQLPNDYLLYFNIGSTAFNNGSYEGFCLDLDDLFNNWAIAGRFDVIIDDWFDVDFIKLHCSTNMYHDMRLKNDSTFMVINTFYTDSIGFQDEYLFLDPRITPYHYLHVNFSEGPWCTGGLDELSGEVLVYPNPVTDIVNIKSESPITNIRVLNLQGQVLLERDNHSEDEVEIDLTGFGTGIYMLKVQHTKNKYSSTKLFKL